MLFALKLLAFVFVYSVVCILSVGIVMVSSKLIVKILED